MSIIGWPTSLIAHYKATQSFQDSAQSHKDFVDYTTWWIFVLGNFKDNRPEYEFWFYKIFGTMMVGLFFEK
jgi:hypothetical protein